MPASGASCDCGCGGSVCTKWLVDAGATYVGNTLQAYGIQVDYVSGFGPTSRMEADFRGCRSILDFAVDEDTKALVVTSFIPPHIDCISRAIGEPYATPCQRRVLDRESVGGGGQYNKYMVQATKVIRVTAGQRIKVNMVTDSICGAYNTLSGDLFSASCPETGGAYFDHFFPSVIVAPASKRVWDTKPCLLQGGRQKNDYYREWPWPDVPQVSSDAGHHPMDQLPLRGYNTTVYDGRARVCSVAAVEEGVRPEDHPPAPAADQYPSIYVPWGYSDYFGSSSIGINVIMIRYGNVMEAPAYTAPKAMGANTELRAGSTTYTSFVEYMPGWYATQTYPWLFSPYTELAYCINPLFPGSEYATFASSPWANPMAYQCIYLETPEGEDSIPTPPEKPTAFVLSVPSLRRGTPVDPGHSNAAGGLRPDYPTDHDYVAFQVEKWNAFYSNVTINEMTLPDYTCVTPQRPRIITNTTPKGVNVRWDSHAETALDGAQNGCTEPGLCDITMTVDVTHTGAWVLHFKGSGSPLTADGSTTVVYITVEEPDPDIEGEWLPVDLTECCGAGTTPDHSGWAVVSGDLPYEFGGSNISYPERYTTAYKNDKVQPCLDDLGFMVVGFELTDYVHSFLAALAPFASIRDGAFMAEWAATFPDDIWAAMPAYVWGEYSYNYSRYVCCGYGELVYPLVGAGCHPTLNIDSVYLDGETGGKIKRQSTYGANSTHPPSPWLLDW